MAEGDRDHHPSPAELERFLLGEATPQQAAPVLAHLLRGCAHCRASMDPTVTVIFGTEPAAPVPASPDTEAGGEYDFPLFKAFATARRYAASVGQAKISPSRERAASALKMAAAPEVGSASTSERDWERCQRLLEICRGLRYSDPEALVLAASLAVVTAERIDPGFRGPAALADLQAYAIAELGNAKRVADDLRGAESELARALQRAAEGTGAPLLLAHLMDLTSSLYIDQGRVEDARVMVDAVYAIHQREGDRQSTGRALISKGFSAVNALEYEEGIRFLSQGLGMIDASRDARLVMSGIFNLVWSLVECGQAKQAEPLFEHSRKLFSAYIERIDGIRFTWLEGRIAAALHDHERAERRLSEARARFEELKMPGYVALVSLDLSALWLRAGRTAEIMTMIEETIAVFRTHGMSREAITSLLIVREALHKQQATEALLHSTAAELLRSYELSTRRGRVLG